MTTILERNMRMRADRPKMTIAAVAAKYRLSYHRAYEIVRDVEGPRASRSPRSGLTRLQADRNAKITAAYFSGATIRELARQHAVSFQRISFIIRREIILGDPGDKHVLHEAVGLPA